jgi:hypothetical protein
MPFSSLNRKLSTIYPHAHYPISSNSILSHYDYMMTTCLKIRSTDQKVSLTALKATARDMGNGTLSYSNTKAHPFEVVQNHVCPVTAVVPHVYVSSCPRYLRP